MRHEWHSIDTEGNSLECEKCGYYINYWNNPEGWDKAYNSECGVHLWRSVDAAGHFLVCEVCGVGVFFYDEDVWGTVSGSRCPGIDKQEG